MERMDVCSGRIKGEEASFRLLVLYRKTSEYHLLNRKRLAIFIYQIFAPFQKGYCRILSKKA
jgi:hypothetical protein